MTVKRLNGDPVTTFTMDSIDCVANESSLKLRLAAHGDCGVAADRQRLFFKGTELSRLNCDEFNELAEEIEANKDIDITMVVVDVVRFLVLAVDDQGTEFRWSTSITPDVPMKEVASQWLAAYDMDARIKVDLEYRNEVINQESSPSDFGWPVNSIEPTIIHAIPPLEAENLEAENLEAWGEAWGEA